MLSASESSPPAQVRSFTPFRMTTIGEFRPDCTRSFRSTTILTERRPDDVQAHAALRPLRPVQSRHRRLPLVDELRAGLQPVRGAATSVAARADLLSTNAKWINGLSTTKA